MNSYMIVLYRNSGYDNPVNVILTDCTAFANTGMTKHTQTVDGTTFEGYSGTPFSPSYANVTDGTVIAKNAPVGQQSIFIDGAEYYIRPNMKMVVSFKQSGTNISYSCDYYVGTTRLTAISDSYLFSNTLYYSLHVGAFKVNDTIYYGFYLREDDRTFRVSTVSENYWDGSFNVTVKSPSKNATANSRVGMRSTASDVIEPGSAFNSLNVLANGGTGLHVYKLTAAQLEGLYGAMLDRSAFGESRYKHYGFSSGVLALHYLPVDISGTVRNYIYINGMPLTRPTTGLPMVTGGEEIAQQTYDTPWVSCRFDKDEFVSDSFLDFAPYVSATLTLPFVGTVSIDVNKVMYGEVRVRYIIDILSGNCLAEVYVTDLDGNPLFFNRYPGNCAYTIPLFANESGGFPILGLFEGIASAGLGISGANETINRAKAKSTEEKPVYAPPNILENSVLKGVHDIAGSVSDMMNWEANTAMIGSLPHNVSALAGNYCIFISLTIKNSLTCLDDKGRDMLKALFGYSSAFYCKLGDLDHTGFVSGEFHADEVPKATEAEKAELEALLREGVYL